MTAAIDRSDDIELARRCAEGDRAAWARFAALVADSVRWAILGTLRAHSGEPDEALVEDLQAEVLLAFAADRFRRLRAYRGEASLRRYAQVAASRLAIDSLRRSRPSERLADHEDDPLGVWPISRAPNPEDMLLRRERIQQLDAWRARLGDADRELLRLHYDEELPFETIVRQTGATHNALYARKCRVHRRLAELAAGDDRRERARREP